MGRNKKSSGFSVGDVNLANGTQKTEVVMPTPQTTELEQLLWDDEDVILEEGHSRNKLQESLRKPEGFSYATNRSIKEIEIELS